MESELKLIIRDFFSNRIVNWDGCQRVWEECAKQNTNCGCIPIPTLLGLLVFTLIAIVLTLLITWYVKKDLLKTELSSKDKKENNEGIKPKED